MQNYGIELILDLHDCDASTFNRDSIEDYFKKICEEIDMRRCDLHFWDDTGVPEEEKQNLPHTTGTSAIQFILTSNITIHTLDILKNVYINIFSCKEFDPDIAERVTIEWFKGKVVSKYFIERI